MESFRRHSSSKRRSQRIPKHVQCSDPGLSHKYFTRRHSSQLRTNDVRISRRCCGCAIQKTVLWCLPIVVQPTSNSCDLFISQRHVQLPLELDAIGFRSPWAFLWYCMFLVAPLAYIYIGLMLLRDLCEYCPDTIQKPLQHYLPTLARLATLMKSYYGFRLVDVWCVIEGLFFIACKLKIRYLQAKDPLEASLSAAPMLDSEERKSLWDHMMSADPDLSWIADWFLDHPSIETISRYDIFDFICWAMFDGRNQEHLTSQEVQDLEAFVEDFEFRISLSLYGVHEEFETLAMSHSQVTDVEATEDRDDASEDGLLTTMNRDRTNSDAATANVNFGSSTHLSSIGEETELFSSPLKEMRQVVTLDEDDSTVSSGSGVGTWSSVGASKRPRPKKCECDCNRRDPSLAFLMMSWEHNM